MLTKPKSSFPSMFLVNQEKKIDIMLSLLANTGKTIREL